MDNDLLAEMLKFLQSSNVRISVDNSIWIEYHDGSWICYRYENRKTITIYEGDNFHELVKKLEE